MKLLLLAALAACAFSLPVSAQLITITADGTTGLINQQPGTSNNFIEPFSGNYSGGQSVNNVVLGGITTSDMTNFSLSGGVSTQNNPGNGTNFATITTPAGQNFLTGTLAAQTGAGNGLTEIAFAFEPIVAGNFNLNDFYLYLMYSNTNGVDNDLSISVAPRSTAQNGGAFGQGTFTTTAVVDNLNENLSGASPSTADYAIFHVQGLGTAVADYPGADLVVLATSTSPVAYVGGVSISQTEIPEPSTYALMLAGGLGLLFLARRGARLNS